MPTLFALCRATAVTVLGVALYGAATLASAASPTMAEDFTFTRPMDGPTASGPTTAQQHLAQKSAVQNPGSRVSLNPQPLPPRQADTVMQSSVSNVLKNFGQALSTAARN